MDIGLILDSHIISISYCFIFDERKVILCDAKSELARNIEQGEFAMEFIN